MIYNNFEYSQDDEFKDALAKEYLDGFDEKKTIEVWNMAWNYGHAEGFYEVENFYVELANLVKKVTR